MMYATRYATTVAGWLARIRGATPPSRNGLSQRANIVIRPGPKSYSGACSRICKTCCQRRFGDGRKGRGLTRRFKRPMPPEHPLSKMPNVIFTPHISGSSLSPSFRKHLWDIFSVNAERYVKGESLLNELTADQLAGG